RTSHGQRAGLTGVASADDDTEHLHRLFATLHVPRPDRFTDHAGCGLHRRRGGDDLTALRLRLQALRDVHRVAHHRVLQPSAAADGPRDHGTGVHADPHAELRHIRIPTFGVELG